MNDLTKVMANISAKVITLSANYPNDTDLGVQVRKLLRETFKKQEDELDNVQTGSKEDIRNRPSNT